MEFEYYFGIKLNRGFPPKARFAEAIARRAGPRPFGAGKNMIPDKQNKIKRIILIIVVVLLLFAFVWPLAVGY